MVFTPRIEMFIWLSVGLKFLVWMIRLAAAPCSACWMLATGRFSIASDFTVETAEMMWRPRRRAVTYDYDFIQDSPNSSSSVAAMEVRVPTCIVTVL